MKGILLYVGVIAIIGISLGLIIIYSPHKKNNHHRPVIIGKDFVMYNKNFGCDYTYRGLGYNEHCFQDSCNKYNIGDTLK